MKAKEVIADWLGKECLPHVMPIAGREFAPTDQIAGRILESLEQAGFTIVPIEPSEKTCEAGAEALRGEFLLTEGRRQTLSGWGAYYAYRAMLKAAEGE
jgi:hypothetical protein